MLPDLWTVVLAGGSGRRLRSLTGSIPKQFWAFGDGQTLVEQTARRIAPLSPDRRRVTVVDRSHEAYVKAPRHVTTLGRVLYQPLDRGTAAGVLLGLTPVLAEDPDAIVLITPADHGVAHVDQFHRGILAAVSQVRAGTRDIVLFGVEPTAPAEDYGWITPAFDGRSVVRRCTGVKAFREKPGTAEAVQLLASGAVWNTMVLIGRARAVFAECRRQIPAVTAAFLDARREPPAKRPAFLAARYPALPAADFSREVIAPARGLGLYTWPSAMGWSDLGTPDRLVAWHAESRATTRATKERTDDDVQENSGQHQCC